ncbi:hypothetical protein BIW11_13447 [Tropilaelaps mercedesae]|uniref:Uncharacterized protein n=1 Tax=Tropilaelaps mercedesae TaxID=418985 RepID=A0A1V9X2F1_9ACAR|nr:hypothetical protein BIW11_13447 [Tropilaelaps mercedesae]
MPLRPGMFASQSGQQGPPMQGSWRPPNQSLQGPSICGPPINHIQNQHQQQQPQHPSGPHLQPSHQRPPHHQMQQQQQHVGHMAQQQPQQQLSVGMMRPVGAGVPQGIPQGGPSGQSNQFPMGNTGGGPRASQNNSLNASNSSIDLNNLDFLDGFDTSSDFGFNSAGTNILDDVLGAANR